MKANNDPLVLQPDVAIHEYKITFNYCTKRGNKRTRDAYVQVTDPSLVKAYFYNCIHSMNEEKGFRAYSDIEIVNEPELVKTLCLVKPFKGGRRIW